MKTIKRMVLGIASSLLLTAGLARAAQQLDPLTQSIAHDTNASSSALPGGPCILPCAYDVE